MSTQSRYAKLFDENNKYWEPNDDYILLFIQSLERMFNNILLAQEHVFLNEIYDEFGFPRTRTGQTHGWVYDPKKKNQIRISATKEGSHKWMLDFNVEGKIIDTLKD